MRKTGWVVVGSMVAAVVAALMIPAGAHVNENIEHLWNGPDHLKDKAKQTFYTKGQADKRYKSQWAQVDDDGTILRQSGGITVTKGDPDGYYYVKFPTSQNLRGVSATPVWTQEYDRDAEAVQCGDTAPGSISCFVSDNSRTIFVEISNSGTNAGEDHPFYVISVP